MNTGQEAQLDHNSVFSVQHQAGTVGGILASITEAEIRVAIQAHLQEEAENEGGREGGMRESRSMKGGGGVLHAHTV